MKKKWVSLLMALALVLGLLPGVALAAKSSTDIAYAVTGGNIYFDKSTGTVTDCDTSVTIANIPEMIDGVKVTSIENGAFYNCSGLISVSIPSSVTSIEYETFSGCSGLTSVSIPSSVTSIENGAFDGCSGLTSVSIPSSVTSIGNYAFSSCSGLTSVSIPSSVTNIADCAFLGCSSLTAITVDQSNTNYCDKDGVLFNKSQTTLVAYPNAKAKSYTIPNSVTSIEIYAFCDCIGLTSVSIPSSVTSIAEYAFSGCSSLTDVYYAGTEAQWKNIELCDYNDWLLGATIHYNSSSTTPDEPSQPTPPATSGTFSDVTTADYFYAPVQWAVENNITTGTSATSFAPADTCTRGQIVTFLWRAAQEPGAQVDSGLTDVAADAYYAKAVAWAIANGVTTGTGATTFSPNAPCTRAQAVTFLWRSAGEPDVQSSNAFADVAASDYYAKAIAWAAETGITTGTSADTFSPNTPCTRGQIVTFLYRADQSDQAAA